jgi:hypothetical protein
LQGTILSASLIATVVTWDNVVIVPWGSAWPKQFLRGTILSSSHPVINNIGCVWRNLVNVACCNATQEVFDQRFYCNGGRRQTSFIAGAMGLHWDGKGLQLARLI